MTVPIRLRTPNRAAGIRTRPATIDVKARTKGSMRPTGTAQAPRPARKRPARATPDSVTRPDLPSFFTSGFPPPPPRADAAESQASCAREQVMVASARGAVGGLGGGGRGGMMQGWGGGAGELAGAAVKDMGMGSVALADFAHVVAAKYPVHIALHTDHCPKDKLDGFMRPLVAISRERVAQGQEPLFQSHMWDGSAVPLEENLQIAASLLAECAAARTVMEMEIGVVGGEEDGVVGEINEKLYSTPDDALATAEALGLRERGRDILAATVRNLHG